VLRIFSLKVKSRSISAPKDPRDPRNGVFTESCFKDFRDFKDNSDEFFKNYLQMPYFNNLSQYADQNRDLIKIRQLEILERQRNDLERVNQLLNQGKESEALREFIRGFPTCVPFRSQNNYLRRM
jgi:hypothetical protein